MIQDNCQLQHLWGDVYYLLHVRWKQQLHTPTLKPEIEEVYESYQYV